MPSCYLRATRRGCEALLCGVVQPRSVFFLQELSNPLILEAPTGNVGFFFQEMLDFLTVEAPLGNVRFSLGKYLIFLSRGLL